MPNMLTVSFSVSTRVLVRPIGLDMVEVGGSNPPGPTKTDDRSHVLQPVYGQHRASPRQPGLLLRYLLRIQCR